MKNLNLITKPLELGQPQSTLEPQPQFPEEDLTDENAAFLDSFLRDESLVDASRTTSEQRERAFELAYQSASPYHHLDMQDKLALAYGYTLYEVVCKIIRPESSDPLEDHIVLIATEWLTLAIKGDGEDGDLLGVADRFSQEQPRSTTVIEDAAKRINPRTAAYAIAGAALERQIQINTREEQAKYGL